MAKMAILPDLVSWQTAMFFITGKVIRFFLYFVFIFSVLSSAGTFLSYSREEIILFFLVFNLIDITTQFIFRGVYIFRHLIVNGTFDLCLTKPLPSFFQPLFGHTDAFDLITLAPLAIFFFYFTIKNQLVAGSTGWLLFFILFFASLLIAFSFHLFICSVGILTTEVDYLVWIYRDLTGMARFPTDIYKGLARFLVTFVVPVVLLITFPVKGLLGLLSPEPVLFSIGVSFLLTAFSLKFWQWSLRRWEGVGG